MKGKQMFELKKEFDVAVAHKLELPYESKCQNLHGHTIHICVYCRADDGYVENNSGMVMDFTKIKQLVHDVLDHNYLNDILEKNPTSENLAKWICFQITNCYKVEVQESPGNVVTYIDDSIPRKMGRQ
jgi:6-pyruvoyltetrahydropterin/6-carboxytetrahydropterin synthase